MGLQAPAPSCSVTDWLGGQTHFLLPSGSQFAPHCTWAVIFLTSG